MGDITPFIITFLEFLNIASKRMCDNLFEGANRLLKLANLVGKQLFLGDKKRQRKIDVMYCFIQNALFAVEPFSVEELQQLTMLSRTSQDSLINELIENGIPIEISKAGRFNRYHLNLDLLEEKLEN